MLFRWLISIRPVLPALYLIGLLTLLILTARQQVLRHEDGGYRMRWVGAGHDRNAHYRYGLEMAADSRNGDLAQFLIDFDAGSWVWPPLNGLLIAGMALVAGPDPMWAIATSLLGWCLTALFAYLIAGRYCPRLLPLVGMVAATCIFLSPAHRAYSTDVMLESLGAGLTLAVLYAYIVWVNCKSTSSAVVLGMALSLLFFQKYNYWLLVVISISIAQVVATWPALLQLARRLWQSVNWRTWLLGQFRRPLNYAILTCMAMTIAIMATGGFTIQWQGKPLDIYTSRLFVTIGYALVVLRFTIWWWTGGRHLVNDWLPGVLPLFYWHVAPVLIWFLIPYRLTTFLWFISPANTEREYHASFLDGLRFYWTGAANEYVPFPELLPILAVGVIISLLFAGRRNLVLPLFAIVGFLLTVKHPNHKLRFLHTVMPAFCVAGVVGYGLLLDMLCRRLTKYRGAMITFGMFLIAAAITLGVIVYQRTDNGGHASEAGLDGRGASLRDITDAISPHIYEDEPIAIFSNVPSKFWAKWCYLERFPTHKLLQVDCRQVGVYGSPTKEQFEKWCDATNCKIVLFVYVSPKSRWFEDAPPDETTGAILNFLPTSQFEWQETEQHDGGVALFIYRKAP